MFTHTVLFKLYDRSPEAVERAAGVLRGMRGRIPSLLELEVGVEPRGMGRAWDIALITRFADREGYEAYRTHPHHGDPVLAHMHVHAAEAAVVDWEG